MIGSPTSAAGRRSTGKPEAVAAAARRVFGREGYPRASIGAIAVEAGVSTRTIYNHFRGKEELFATVLLDSADRVADALCARIAAHLDDVDDLPAALLGLGREWVSPLVEFADHFAMVRQVTAEAAHAPPGVLAAWRDAGPGRVERELADRLARLAADGRLDVPDAGRAAIHYTQLVAGEVNARTHYGAIALDDDEIQRCVDAGVAAFLNGHLPRPAVEHEVSA